MGERLKAHLALLGANLFYGAGYTVAKAVMPRLIEPLGFIFIRVSAVTALFWLSSWHSGQSKPFELKEWRTLALSAFFGVALNQMLFFLGLSKTYPIHASLIMMTTPLLITVGSVLLLRERIERQKMLGLLLGIGGAFLLMSEGKTVTFDAGSALGDLFVFLNAASYAIYLIMIKPLMQRHPPIVVIRWVFLFGMSMVFPFGWQQFMAIQWSQFLWIDYAAVAFIVLCVTYCTYLWNMFALRRLTPSTAGAYIYLQPLFASLISILFTGESLSIIKGTSATLIFVGVWMVNFGFSWKRKRRHDQMI